MRVFLKFAAKLQPSTDTTSQSLKENAKKMQIFLENSHFLAFLPRVRD